MTKQLIPIMWLFLLLGLQSCGNEDEKFENIEFKTTGVTLSPLPNGISYYGEIDLEFLIMVRLTIQEEK